MRSARFPRPRHAGFAAAFCSCAFAAAACSGSGGDEPPPVRAGAAAVEVTPRDFEGFRDLDGDALFDGIKQRAVPCGPDVAAECFFDTGVDRLYSFEEPGAFGPDGAPGRAGVDDDGNGLADDCDRAGGCPEHRAAGSDDDADPAGDDHHPLRNPDGTEGDGRFQYLVLAGFQGFMSFEHARMAQGIEGPLWVRALALEQGGETVLLAAMDLVGMFHTGINPARRRIEEDLGVPFDHQVFASVHTHHGPDTMGIWAAELDAAYMTRVREAMFEASRLALERMAPVEMRVASGRTIGCLDRTTLDLAREPDCRLAMSKALNLDPEAGYDEPIAQNDLRDPWVRDTDVAAARFDRLDGSGTVATLVGWNDHPEMLEGGNNLVSADFPHYVRERVEDTFGGIAIYFSGVLGGQIGALRGTRVPLRDEAGETVVDVDADGNLVLVLVGEPGVAKIRSVGFLVADEAIVALEGAAAAPRPPLTIRSAELWVPLENPLFRLLFAIAPLKAEVDERDLPFDGEGCGPGGCVRTDVAIVRVGDLVVATVPGEMPPEYLVGRPEATVAYPGADPAELHFPAMEALAGSLGGSVRMVVSLANNELGYLIPASDYMDFTLAEYLVGTGNTTHPNFYEEAVSAGKSFGDEVAGALLGLAEGRSGGGQR